MRLSPVSQKLYDALLYHHMLHDDNEIQGAQIDKYLITYGDLCEMAGMPDMAIGIGQFLGEIANYCSCNGWPPINALAVNARTKKPGYNYDSAQGCTLERWPDQVKQVLLFRDYK